MCVDRIKIAPTTKKELKKIKDKHHYPSFSIVIDELLKVYQWTTREISKEDVWNEQRLVRG